VKQIREAEQPGDGSLYAPEIKRVLREIMSYGATFSSNVPAWKDSVVVEPG